MLSVDCCVCSWSWQRPFPMRTETIRSMICAVSVAVGPFERIWRLVSFGDEVSMIVADLCRLQRGWGGQVGVADPMPCW